MRVGREYVLCDSRVENTELFPKRKLRGIGESWHRAGIVCHCQQVSVTSQSHQYCFP